MQPGIPVLIGDKTHYLHFNLQAALTLEEKFGVKFFLTAAEIKQAREKAAQASVAEDIRYCLQLAYCMTRTNDNPPTLTEIESIDLAQLPALRAAVNRAMEIAKHGPLGEAQAAAAKPPVKSPRHRDGIGMRHSSRR